MNIHRRNAATPIQIMAASGTQRQPVKASDTARQFDEERLGAQVFDEHTMASPTVGVSTLFVVRPPHRRMCLMRRVVYV